ncbi:F-box/kelch-repeat protein At3g06240 [Medicago truncatula]|uniref:F-box/kelch-repeat protein At3g06240 n=1 Tax=Medicago truncatula TaxID=3880 RepID=UPI00196738C6|nr:F-box/kelch-repeat protein At3g06240 [Medicago truncatula]
MEKSIDHVTTEKVSNHIPDDLEFFIVSKLPLKSLKRFSCVRKSWSHLFQNSNFMNMYRNYFISNNHSSYEEDGSCLLLQQTLPYFPNHRMLYLLSGETFENKVKLDWPPPFQDNGQSVFILGPVMNGIVCLYQGCTPIIVLWNPTTDKLKVLPHSPIESPILYELKYVYLHGFGHDHIKDDYKVIRYASYSVDAPNIEDYREVEIVNQTYCDVWEIYSLRSNSWRKIDLDMPQCYGTNVGAFVYMNGVCHWYCNDINEPLLVSFDLHEEVFCELGVKESWTKLFIFGPLPSIEHPIGEGSNGDLFFRRKNDELVWFNLNTQIIEELGVKGELHCCQIVIYKESLLRLGGIND